MSNIKQHSCKEKIEQFYLRIFKIPDNILVFFSGIFVSFAINLLTGPITSSPEKITWNDISWNIWLSVIFMIVASLLLIVWACIIKPYQDDFSHESPANQKDFFGWKNVLTREYKYKTILKLTFLLVLFIVFLSLSIIFVFI